MLNLYKKLSVGVLLGAMTLGMSSVAVAKSDFVATNWIVARKQLDCPMTCKALEMYVIMGGTDHKDRKPISICATKDNRSGEWLVGNNRWEQKSCTVAIGDKVFHGERYDCLCTTHMLQPLR